MAPFAEPALLRMKLGGPQVTEGQNALMVQFFEWDSTGGKISWWKHFEDQVPRMKELGVTQVWLPPPNKAMRPKGQGYDAYDLWDLGEFNQKGSIATRWGTKEELIHAIQVAREHGIDVLIDAVLNHKLGADRREKFLAIQVDDNDRRIDLGPAKEIEGWTGYDMTGRGNKHSSLKWSHQHFTGVDYDHITKTKGVFKIAEPGRKGWSHRLIRNLAPDVRRDLMDWGVWVLRKLVQQVSDSMPANILTGSFSANGLVDVFSKCRSLKPRLCIQLANARNTHGQQVFAVGEFWNSDVAKLVRDIRAFPGEMCFFDVPLHQKFFLAGQQGSKFDLRKILRGSLVQARPRDACTFVDNHDTRPEGSLVSWVGQDNMKLIAYALILLRPDGHPCVYHGDIFPDPESHIGRDLPAKIEVLCAARKLYAYGGLRDYFTEKNLIGFVRSGDDKHPGGCAVVMCNLLESERTGETGIAMNVGANLLDPSATTVTVPSSGNGWFPCSEQVAVWVKS
ncbi:Glycoside hydrolase family 13 protein [Rhizoctonia solani]|uniref:Glycoside hydrolase family 13 protein n=1 Tax=Rhizoctonia solani TaxID=456999 RepID=A0A8H7M3X9_9AGAM|nr:Glycoside hydrolase family 13 protein [Rhizoctonia solani]